LKFTVKTSDGRQLATQLDGDPEGRPIFLLHGTPGSRLGPGRGPLFCTASVFS
jgi:hypothetical protein